MVLKRIFSQLNIYAQCRQYGVSLWQCPQFLFLVMGSFIIVVSLFSYLIGTRYIEDPAIIALIVLMGSTILFIIAFIITRSFERLAEASKLKSEFIDLVSHQMRSPLTNLKWTFEILSSEKMEMDLPKKDEYYSLVKENIGRMMELLNDLLIVSKIEQETFPFRKKEISLEDLIKDLVSRYRPFSEASNVKLKVYLQENLPKIFADPSSLKLALENLLDNAIRYTKDGGEVEISLERREKELYFKIKDSGLGIPKEDQKYVFQKFFRAGNVSKEQTQGSGLGLYITKAIIKKSGGKIWFESEEGKGTTFYFTLPIK